MGKHRNKCKVWEGKNPTERSLAWRGRDYGKLLDITLQIEMMRVDIPQAFSLPFEVRLLGMISLR